MFIKPHLRQRRQQGAIALMLLMVVGLGIAGAILAGFSRHALEVYREQQTQNVLAEAKKILLAEALSKRGNTVPVTRPGEFFCPDLNIPGEAAYGQSGLNGAACPGAAARIGRIPWRSYQAAELRDSSGEPLWMAVADGFQERRNTPLNSDTAPAGANPWFYAAANNGAQALSDAADPVIVVILAPGAALSGQNRSTAAQQRNANNYLECNRLTVGGACLGAPNNYANYNATQGRFLNGPRLDANANPTLNDRLITIRRSELLAPLEKRAAQEYQQLINLWAVQAGAGSLPNPASPADPGCADTAAVNSNACTPSPVVCRGHIPKSIALTGVGLLPVLPEYLVNPANRPAAMPGQAAWQNVLLEYDWLYRNRWEQMFFYAVANTPNCPAPIALTLRNMQTPAAAVNAVMIGAGVAQTGQTRVTAADKALLNNYLDPVSSYAAAPDINRRAWDAVPPQTDQYAKLGPADAGNDRLYYRVANQWTYAPKDRP
ncbi:hypothetical protein HA050_14920 [Iodobacter sp. HSC-16F04]|uniref:Uncharacterized protein n=1 Tax=Iodobacter violaceini TaxID=3044271 RepID=A0ABX0KTV6_9NEIS|nr:hypothetical protein [Iodobacter violacea]NHQ87407.1 hypothetical protein [Iodobacter violacea]